MPTATLNDAAVTAIFDKLVADQAAYRAERKYRDAKNALSAAVKEREAARTAAAKATENAAVYAEGYEAEYKEAVNMASGI